MSSAQQAIAPSGCQSREQRLQQPELAAESGGDQGGRDDRGDKDLDKRNGRHVECMVLIVIFGSSSLSLRAISACILITLFGYPC
mmetsp:Transcript_27009/g.49145  ORF Transcript_27009/g.49145 Transcript_27009/m.49145 type:complete len:85 (+) Transcript_27009:1358-1612(+)